ncbi:MAG: helix-turn-helix domain-containing protein [Eubacteriales bacterium]|nr:helix-turn-helix domain-containing protein [Eubacteriales bacterium]
MQLNLDIIQEYLPEAYQTRRYGPAGGSCVCPRPLLYEGDGTFEEGTLYIARADTLPKELPPRNCAFVAVGTRVPHEWLLGGVQLLTVGNAGSVLKLFNEVQRIYDSFDRWDARLRDELEKEVDFDIRKILTLGSERLGRDIGVVNHTLRQIFRSEIKPDNSIVIDDKPQIMSMEYSEMIKEVCNRERMITVPYLSAIERNSVQYYCFNLYTGGSFSGCISIGEDKGGSFKEGDFPLMDHFFAYFDKAFFKYLRSCVQEDSAGLIALRKLLEHIPLTAEEEKQLALMPGERWCCFRLKERRKGKSFPKDYMYASISAVSPRNIYAVLHHDEIAGLLRLQEKEKTETLKFFETSLQRMGYYGGISNSFTDFACLNDYFGQAVYAVEQGGETEASLHYFQDHVLNYMLYSCTGEQQAEALFSDGLTALREHDRKKGTEYLKTLDVYLQNEMSVTRTAEAMFIHRSSLLKRLEKIRRLLGNDLSDSRTRLYYRLSLALLDEK